MTDPLFQTSITCSICGKNEVLVWNGDCNRKLAFLKQCFLCNHWAEKVEWTDFLHEFRDLVVRVSGGHYKIGPEPLPGEKGMYGYGGRAFHIQFMDGRKVTSHNLWHQGTIPPHFRAMLPDNAVFIEQTITTEDW